METKAKIIIAALVAGYLTTGFMDTQDAARSEATYCEMTRLYQETKGQYGWPDYRGNAEEVCK